MLSTRTALQYSTVQYMNRSLLPPLLSIIACHKVPAQHSSRFLTLQSTGTKQHSSSTRRMSAGGPKAVDDAATKFARFVCYFVQHIQNNRLRGSQARSLSFQKKNNSSVVHAAKSHIIGVKPKKAVIPDRLDRQGPSSLTVVPGVAGFMAEENTE